MKNYLSTVFLLLLLCGSLLADKQARVVKYSERDIVELHCQLKVSTVIILPTGEQVLDFTTGDKDLWIINGANNFCYIHPTKPGSTTNLNLICASGNTYSFLLIEVSAQTPPPEVDYKVFVEAQESSQLSPIKSLVPRFVSSEELLQYKKQVANLQEQITAVQEEARKSKARDVNTYKAQYPVSLRFAYQYKSVRPFDVIAMFHDESFTYIHSNTREKPAMYEIKDNKPNLVNFQLEDGCYIVPKILDRGYLQIGKKKMEFRRQGT
jgi:type IV secretory pathway VirB9-like protein